MSGPSPPPPSTPHSRTLISGHIRLPIVWEGRGQQASVPGPGWPSRRLRPYQGPGLFPAVLQGCCRTGQAGPQSGPFPKDSGSWELWGKVHLAKVWKMKQQPKDRPASVSFGLFYSATPFLEQSSALVTGPSSAVKGARVAAGRSEVRAAGWAGPQTLRRRRQHLQGGAGRPHSAQESWESQQVEVERSL